MPEKDMFSFIEEKKGWILKKQQEILLKIKNRETIQAESELKVLYLGDYYPIVPVENYKYAMNFDKTQFCIDTKYLPHKKRLLQVWYNQQAKRIIHERAVMLSKASGLTFTDLKINSAKKRWGSCSGKKSLNFSWRLIMAPMPVIDYVVIHELAHTIEMNHSAKFWGLVGKNLPNFKNERTWLKDNGYLLNV